MIALQRASLIHLSQLNGLKLGNVGEVEGGTKVFYKVCGRAHLGRHFALCVCAR